MLSRLVFTLFLALGMSPLPAADVSFFGMAKGQQFEQAMGGAPALLASNAFTFQAFVIASTNGVVTNATLQVSNGTPLRQLAADTNGVLWRYEDFTTNQTQLDAVYPAGPGASPTSYTFTMATTNDGVRTVSLNFWMLPPFIAISYPATPQITNLAAAQAIDHTRDFTLQWNSVGNALTIVQLTVLDSASNAVFASPAPFQSGALSGTSTSFVIPAFALPPGETLIAHLTAANPGLPNTNTYVGATGIATLAKDTKFPMTTRPMPVLPKLDLLSVSSGQALLRATQLETNRLYHLQTGTNLATWLDVAVTNPVTTSAQFTDAPAAGLMQNFYRLRIGQ